jgi:hypothetical protein
MYHLHLDMAHSRITSASTIEELAEAVADGLEVLSFDDVAGSIPDAFYDLDAMPDDLTGLVAFTATHELRIDFATSTLGLHARPGAARRTSNG